jgi:hypothetical protein
MQSLTIWDAVNNSVKSDRGGGVEGIWRAVREVPLYTKVIYSSKSSYFTAVNIAFTPQRIKYV